MKPISLLALLIACLPFPNAKGPNLITYTSIGSIELCQDIDAVQLPYQRDTLYSSNGFYFYGHFYGKPSRELLVVLQHQDSSKVVHLHTQSPYYQTQKGIRVGSTLYELVKALPNIQFTSILSGYEDLYFFDEQDHKRIEYRLDYKSEREIYGLSFLDDYYSIDDVKGMRELLNQKGHQMVIREIRVANLASCYPY